ncbi:MAG: hypothetical protein D6719_07225 [Candidatus Dadabacteria bacterium]|nr:MAG: hypothetical protein D6719_07225 [Candidatus Dadabacteria bacterium]
MNLSLSVVSRFRKREQPTSTVADSNPLAAASFGGRDRTLLGQHELDQDQNALQGMSPEDIQREHFKKYAKPYILPGREDAPVVIMYAGLASTTLPWRETADRINQETGLRVEVYTLKGHDGTQRTLLATSDQDWVDDIKEKIYAARENGFLPIMFFASTSAVAGVEALRQVKTENPDDPLFGAVAMMGAPFKLRNPLHEWALSAANWVSRHVPYADWLATKLRWKTVPFRWDEHDRRRHPKIESVPVKTLLDLKHLKESAKEGIALIDRPVLVFQGARDGYVKPSDSREMLEYTATDRKDRRYEFFPDSPHLVMNGPEKERFLNITLQWVNRLLEEKDFSAPAVEANEANWRRPRFQRVRRLVRRLRELWPLKAAS